MQSNGYGQELLDRPLTTSQSSPASLEAPGSSEEERVTSIIRQATGGLIRQLKVESVNKEIVITGVTDLYYHKQLVTRAVLGICGSDTLRNNITVSS